MRRSLFAAVTVVILLVPTSALAQGEVEQDLIVLTGNAYVAPDERVDTVVVFDGSATIEGTVDDTVVIFNGPATITGSVAEDVLSFNGTVVVEDGAVIGGDLNTRLEADVAEGATVRGDIRRDVSNFFREPFSFFGKLASWLAMTVSTVVLGLLLLLLAPRGADRVADAWRTGRGPSVGWGFILLFGLPIAAGLILVTVLGIPLGVALLMALFLIYSIGYTAGMWLVGRTLVKEPASRFAAFLAGWGIFRLLALIPIVAGIAGAIATILGLGAIAVAIWRSRGVTTPAAPVPA